ncbi:Apre_1838 family putative sactipeptide bacteriocin [Acetobacterium carbinolicum]|uniref:Apre_1838 family putative sactipeptide bacteriocin n=1 Tax=Acetobacterium carbinolicum TaxID=52690 RepID=UPI002A41D0EB|nr:Apre_1838 family putative sactipeptide bacteriocin [Acetobacterium sp.]
MKIVNPIGRIPENGIQPRACMCSNLFANYKGNDNCFHCGCGCLETGEYSSGNRNRATVRFGASNE